MAEIDTLFKHLVDTGAQTFTSVRVNTLKHEFMELSP